MKASHIKWVLIVDRTVRRIDSRPGNPHLEISTEVF